MENKTLAQRNQEAIEFFHELTVIGDKAKQAFQHIIDTFNIALPAQDIPTLLKLISFIEEGDGYSSFKCIGKTYRLLRILHLIELESKFQQPLFIEGCTNVDELMEKYMIILFAIRRLSFCISEDSINEAVDYLRTYPVSYFSVHALIDGEFIVTNDFFYELILYTYQSIWSEQEKNNFLKLTAINQ